MKKVSTWAIVALVGICASLGYQNFRLHKDLADEREKTRICTEMVNETTAELGKALLERPLIIVRK